ncbi:MAG TPA: carboxypeptidase-like regulatory domain-containing protein [Syntrophobacteria bacterium]|nr:carboxypeptidase-like regulatory domain-containing protein [Syntrophobacteria bacterium]
MSLRSATAVAIVLCLAACSPKISGTVRLVDENMKPVPGEGSKGTVINLINTTASIEKASSSVLVEENGKFESAKDSIKPGMYKVEASRIGYETETQTVKIGSMTRKNLDFTLKKIPEGQRKSIAGTGTDADKIINPGEVNIRPPGL